MKNLFIVLMWCLFSVYCFRLCHPGMRRCIVRVCVGASPEYASVYRPSMRRCIVRVCVGVSSEYASVYRPSMRRCIVRVCVGASPEYASVHRPSMQWCIGSFFPVILNVSEGSPADYCLQEMLHSVQHDGGRGLLCFASQLYFLADNVPREDVDFGGEE